MARNASLIVLLGIIAALGFVFFRVMADFWLPLFLAALLVVIFRPVHQWILDRCEGKQKRAAVLTTLAILFIVLGPLIWVVALAVSEVEVLFARPWASEMGERVNSLRAKAHLEMPYAEAVTNIEDGFHKLLSGQLRDDGTTPIQIDDEYRLATLDQVAAGIQSLFEMIERDGLPAGVEINDEELAQRQRDLIDQINSARQPVTGPEYYQRLDQAYVSYRVMKQQLLGGTTWAWLIELANPSPKKIQRWQGQTLDYLQTSVLSLTGQTTAFVLSILFGLFVLIISLYYFLVDGPNLIRAGMRMSPLDDQYEEELLTEFATVSRAVVLATLLSAVVQGILAGIGYVAVGASPLFLLIILTMLLAMVPFVGAAAVWVPVALWVIFIDKAPAAEHDGRLVAGIGFAIYGFVVISMADNFIKPWVLHGQSKLHPLLALLSVLGGVKALGPIGLLVGPMVVAFLQVLLTMLNSELRHIEKNALAGPREPKVLPKPTS